MAADLNMDQNFVRNLADPDNCDQDYAATVNLLKIISLILK